VADAFDPFAVRGEQRVDERDVLRTEVTDEVLHLVDDVGRRVHAVAAPRLLAEDAVERTAARRDHRELRERGLADRERFVEIRGEQMARRERESVELLERGPTWRLVERAVG